MKQCGYCGRENPDEATHCSECRSLLEPLKPKSSKIRSFSGRRLLLRGLIAIFVGLTISGIALRVAYRQSVNSVAWVEQKMTARDLERLRDLLVAYQRASNSFPQNYQTFQSFALQVPVMAGKFQIEDGFRDLWDHPYVFTNESTNCVIISYGADGKPGGVGVDCDLSTLNPLPKQSTPTFQQFWEHKKTQDMILLCFICGAMAAALSLFTVRVPDLTPRGWLVLGLSLGATLLGTLIVTSMITALHVPSGH
jgi:general secretion pathway protein G